MMNIQTARMRAQYRAWADRVIFESVAALPPGEAEKERMTLFKIIGTLNHTYAVDLIWQAHLEGREHGFTARNTLQQLPALWATQQKMNDWIIDWAAEQNELSFDEDVLFTFVSGAKAMMKRGEMFLHLVTHDSYHRGWVAEMYFEAGVRPPETGLSVSLCEAPGEWRAFN
jgi:uncharacterized damage-inducible protein DinB